eukprot:TRINITY_DN32_c0_g1_i1.p1 TRINITY_DN32_c0_g1~~TRINITY_DN32_c0_g1_i1.p1  ORF type:complete len:574 (-),score=257.26 TRINITY_DN32_c0_g1_i1:122-1843(-)
MFSSKVHASICDGVLITPETNAYSIAFNKEGYYSISFIPLRTLYRVSCNATLELKSLTSPYKANFQVIPKMQPGTTKPLVVYVSTSDIGSKLKLESDSEKPTQDFKLKIHHSATPITNGTNIPRNDSIRSSRDTQSTDDISMLSNEEKEHVSKIFEEYDTDGNGDLSVEEFEKLMRQLIPNVSNQWLNKIRMTYDFNADGKFDKLEFLAAYANCRWDVSKLVRQTFEWEIPAQEITMEGKLGEGAFGVVHKAKWRGLTVAAKQLKSTSLPNEVMEEFRKEVDILGKLRHPNIVLLLGASTQPPSLIMVTEFLPGGTVFQLLHEKKERIPIATAAKMAWQTGLALNYLHLNEPQILHRDLKSMNLLLDSHRNVKVCDFGLSCVKPKKEEVKDSVGSPFWMAPEVLTGQPYNEKADVYSFGVCMYEMIANHVPFSEITKQNPNALQTALQKIVNGERAPFPPNTNPEYAEIVVAAWAPSSNQRQSFTQLVPRLEVLYHKLEKEATIAAQQQQAYAQQAPPSYPYPQYSPQMSVPGYPAPQAYQQPPPTYHQVPQPYQQPPPTYHQPPSSMGQHLP